MKDPKITMDTVRAALVLLQESGPHMGRVIDARSVADCAVIRKAVEDVAKLASIERGLKRIAEAACNGYYGRVMPRGGGNWGDAEQADADTRRAKLATKAAAILDPYGVSSSVGGDVRGSQLRIRTPKSGASNTWGGASDGWAL